MGQKGVRHHLARATHRVERAAEVNGVPRRYSGRNLPPQQRDATAPPQSQLVMLVGAIVIVPIIIADMSWAYWVFRGKVGTRGYH